MVYNTAPGINRWLGAEPDNQTALVDASGVLAAAQASLAGSYKPVPMQQRKGRWRSAGSYQLQRHAAAVDHTSAPILARSGNEQQQQGSGSMWEITRVDSPRPIAAVPAPGWRFHGDCKQQGQAAAMRRLSSQQPVLQPEQPEPLLWCKDAATVAADAAAGRELIVVHHDPATAPRTTGSYPRSPSPRPMERSQGYGREAIKAGGSSSEAFLDADASLEAGGLAVGKQLQETSTTTVRITIPPGAQGTNFAVSANVGSPAKGMLGASIHVSPLQSSKHAGELQALAGEIQRRESTFKGMLGELERITAKCAELTDNISGAAGRGAGKGTEDRNSSGAEAGPVGGLDSTGAAQEEWSWEALMQFERTIKEQHRKLVEQGILPADFC
ncbi:hypothetical protein N2152v2_004133 [Parachlorella kessleri]